MAQSHAATLDAPVSRWPGVLGVIGIVLAILTIIDKASDLLWLLMWSEADWARVLAPDLARLVVNVMPPTAWLVTSSLAWIALSVLLLGGSLELWRRHRSGIARCGLWARLAIGWIAVEWTLGLWWLGTIADEISAVAPAGWQATAAPAILLALALMVAYPVLLLVWFARESIRHEYAGWSE